MENSKLIALLKTFNTQELREFKDFVASPYFNKNQELVLFYDYLKKIAPKFSAKATTRQTIYNNLFPKNKYDDKHMNYLMSFLLKLAERYIGLRKYQTQKLLPEYHTLASMIDRNLEKHYQQTIAKTNKLINDKEQLDINHYYHKFLLADIAHQHWASKKERKFNNLLQFTSDYFDLYFLANKLKYSCEMLNNQQSVSSPFIINMINEIDSYLEKKNLTDEPIINCYYHILKILTTDTPEPYFIKLKNLLNQNFEVFTKEEMQPIYFHTLNFCIRNIRKGKKAYIEESLNLYVKGIESKLLLENNYLSPWTFKNVVKLGLRLERYDWTEQFIQTHHQMLEENFRKDALQYNLADLYYYKGDNNKAIEHLRNVEFTDVYYALDSREMLIRIYYELGEDESLTSLIASFSIYLKRNKIISNKVKQTYLNFITILKLLLKKKNLNPKVLEEKINTTELLVNREWLIKQCEKTNPSK